MALAAHSLGFGSYWMPIYDMEESPNSPESKAIELLKLPDHFRLVYLLPMGKPAQDRMEERINLTKFVDYNHFGNKQRGE